MVLWEAVLSPALQVLFDKLTSGDFTEFLRKWNINYRLIEKLKIVYFTNTVVLDDAEEKQHSDAAVETWLNMLKDAIYEAEDVLDELATEALRCDMEFNSTSVSNRVRNWKLISSLNPFSEGIESRIEKLIDKLEYIAKQKDALGLKGEAGKSHGVGRRNTTTPLLIDSRVYGRNNDVEKILNILTDSGTNKGQITVVPILGMGGIGKTTLAQCVFNDKRIDEDFDLKAWACVSDKFDITGISRAILESTTCKPWNTGNVHLLQDSLKEQFTKKRFLIVLDDVWNENYDNWHELLIPFMFCAHGSKIIVTTRNEEVVSVMNTLPPYILNELTDDACWSLFLHHAFRNKNPDDYPSLKNIGREIVGKCRGLPLAAKSLGGMLGSKLDINHWRSILSSNIWELPSKKCSILPALRLSYDHLPLTLKRCFAYCSIFPKDYEYDKQQLVLLWMAEGFVQQEESKTMEEVGEEYFREMLSRSFFQDSPTSNSRFVMHDLINDLAQFVSRKMCIRLEDKMECSKQVKLSERIRHLSFIRKKYDVYHKFETLDEAVWLRTFLPLASPFGTGFCYLSKKVPNDLLPKLRCLRVLSLSGYCITELPGSIGSLKLLRYFDLSHTAIKLLPESVCALCNLQTLMLNGCTSLEKLPSQMGNLVSLRYLDVSDSGLQEMPLQIGRLISLRKLPEFIVGNGGIGELRDLQHIKGTLTISKLENVVNEWEARD